MSLLSTTSGRLPDFARIRICSYVGFSVKDSRTRKNSPRTRNVAITLRLLSLAVNRNSQGVDVATNVYLIFYLF